MFFYGRHTVMCLGTWLLSLDTWGSTSMVLQQLSHPDTGTFKAIGLQWGLLGGKEIVLVRVILEM